jgi:hypothetical protein
MGLSGECLGHPRSQRFGVAGSEGGCNDSANATLIDGCSGPDHLDLLSDVHLPHASGNQARRARGMPEMRNDP